VGEKSENVNLEFRGSEERVRNSWIFGFLPALNISILLDAPPSKKVQD